MFSPLFALACTNYASISYAYYLTYCSGTSHSIPPSSIKSILFPMITFSINNEAFTDIGLWILNEFFMPFLQPIKTILPGNIVNHKSNCSIPIVQLCNRHVLILTGSIPNYHFNILSLLVFLYFLHVCRSKSCFLFIAEFVKHISHGDTCFAHSSLTNYDDLCEGCLIFFFHFSIWYK